MLSKSLFGKVFIKFYCAINIGIVRYFGESKFFKKLFIVILDNFIINLQKNGVESTYYADKKRLDK